MSDLKVALVTGAATGIGRACAERLANDGFAIAANYRSRKEEIGKVMAALKSGEHLMLQGDISDSAAVPQLIKAVVEKFGRLMCW